MKRLLNYLPIHFLVFLILGICLKYFYRFWEFGFLNLYILLVSILMLLLLFKSKVLRTIISFLLFFTLGVASVYFQNDINYNNYYQPHLKDKSATILKINKVLKSGNYYHKFEAKVYQVDSIKTRGTVLLNIKKDDSILKLDVDDFLLLKSQFKKLIPPLNPHQFDYKSYLKKRGIHQQIFINSNQYRNLNRDVFSLKGLSAKIRDKIQNALKKYNFSKDEFGVINALLLGQRQDISKELLNDYSKAGAIHILAVSGLHVGIILLILTWLFKPLDYIKNGKLFKTVFIILILWSFALIAGLSASVVRAVTMFTFVAIGMFFRRKNVVEFSLISSMFFLLIFNPMFLFDVGFQLSYLAVFGIIWVQPKLYNLWKPKFKFIDFFWRLFTVSVAAQVGILPISIYYFHQFPGLFLLSNLIIIPFLGAILIGGILIIVLAVLNYLPQFLADSYGFIISMMNAFVQWISHQESFLFSNLSMSFGFMIALYFMIFSVVGAVFKYSPKRLMLFLVSIMCLQITSLSENYFRENKNEFIVFHKSRNSVIGNRIGNSIKIKHNVAEENLENINFLKSYKVGENVLLENSEISSNIFNLKKDKILIVDSLGIYKINNLKPEVVLIQHSPKINMERLIRILKPKQIVADGSNYKSYVNTWEETCVKLKTPFHYTGQKGAYIFNY